jgi:hypothetical protein
MSDDEIIQQRVSGCTVAEVNKVLDRFAETTIDDRVRKHTLALELARLDELQETFYARAMEGTCSVLREARTRPVFGPLAVEFTRRESPSARSGVPYEPSSRPKKGPCRSWPNTGAPPPERSLNLGSSRAPPPQGSKMSMIPKLSRPWPLP